MYLTSLNNLIGIVLDIGSRGFNFALYLFSNMPNEICLFSIDTDYFVLVVSILIVKGVKKWLTTRCMH